MIKDFLFEEALRPTVESPSSFAFYNAYKAISRNPDKQEEIVIELLKYLKMGYDSSTSHLLDHFKLCPFQQVIKNPENL